MGIHISYLLVIGGKEWVGGGGGGVANKGIYNCK